MKIAICDDEPADLERLKIYCIQYNKNIPLELFSSGTELLSTYDTDYYDIVLLDIEMPAPDGLSVGKALSEMPHPPVIIFTTNSMNYAIQGYGIALRYLLKPIRYSDFFSVIQLALSKISSQKISVNSRGEQILIPIKDILYVEVQHHDLIIHLCNNNSLETRGSLEWIMSKLEHSTFAQPHKSYCVNLEYIDRMTRQTVTMTNGDIIPISRGKSESFQAQLNAFM